MRRVVITGAGIISCLGNNLEEVRSALKEGRSGIRFNQSYADIGMRSQISGSVRLNTEELIDRKLYRFMGEASAYAYLSICLLYTSPSPRDVEESRMPSSA